MNDRGTGSWPARRARTTPDKVALVDAGAQTTYRALADACDAVAHGLRELGVARGDRVAYLGLNSRAFVEVMFAVAKLGAVVVPLNTRLAPAETAAVLADCTPSLLVWDAELEPLVRSDEVTALRLRAVPVTSLDRTPAAGAPAVDEPVDPDDLFMIQYTSGTSGTPKGVMLSHANIAWNVYNLLVDVDLSSDEVALVTAPLFHTAALNQLLLPTLLKGGTAVLEPRWDPSRALDLIEQAGVTYLFGVTSMYLSLSQAPRWATANLGSLRIALSGGSPLPESLLRAYVDRGLMIVQGYGLTEAAPGATLLRPADGLRKLGSAGTVCFFSDVRIIDAAGDPVTDGEPGEVLVQGPNVTAGYWRSPQATDAAFVGQGWLRTGDLARWDDEGHLHVVGRLKDMFISGGENVYPAEVEGAISTHPAVEESAVIGVPDERWGEVGRAVVTLRPGTTLDEEELLGHLRGRLAGYKVPRTVVFVDQLPHNGSGKLVKAAVRNLYGQPSPDPASSS